MKKLTNNCGITLISLVVTIIVLLILVGVSIATLTGKNGIITQADNAKIETIVATVKENLSLEEIERSIDEEEVTPETLLVEGRVKRTVQQAEDGNYYMHYVLKEDAVDGMQGLGKGNIASLKDVFVIDDKLKVKYIGKSGKEYGDNIEEKILEDETKVRFSSKSFSEYVSKISGVTEEEMKFKWMKNQTSLTIADSSVDSLEDLVFFPNLISLTIGDHSNNAPQITIMDGIENCTKLKKLTILYGPDKDYSAVSKLDNLESFGRRGGNDYNNIIDSLKLCQNIKIFEIINCKMKDMSRISELSTNLTCLALSGVQLTKMESLENMRNLVELNLENNQINEIEGLENLQKLQSLNLNNNNIEDITPLSVNKSLTNLKLIGNNKIDGNRANYTGERLEALNEIGKILDRNGTIDIDVDKLGLFTNYKKLNLYNQNLTTLEHLEGLTELTNLNLNSNKLTLEDEKSQEILRSMTNLTELYLINNNITNVEAINDLPNLKILSITGNKNINLKDMEDIISKLNVLRLSNETLKTIVNCDINKIQRLKLSDSYLTELPDLSNFVKLIELNLRNNKDIKDFSMISKMNNLQILNLSMDETHNRMIDFSNLTNLTNLNLSENALWSEDLESLKALKNNTNLTLDLSKNSIIDASALLVLNPNTKINLSGNINLSEESKTALSNHFKNNVTF